jgi:hypothetical protein
MSEVILHRAQVDAGVGEVVAAQCRSICGCAFFNPALSPATEIK